MTCHASGKEGGYRYSSGNRRGRRARSRTRGPSPQCRPGAGPTDAPRGAPTGLREMTGPHRQPLLSWPPCSGTGGTRQGPCGGGYSGGVGSRVSGGVMVSGGVVSGSAVGSSVGWRQGQRWGHGRWWGHGQRRGQRRGHGWWWGHGQRPGHQWGQRHRQRRWGPSTTSLWASRAGVSPLRPCGSGVFPSGQDSSEENFHSNIKTNLTSHNWSWSP